MNRDVELKKQTVFWMSGNVLVKVFCGKTLVVQPKCKNNKIRSSVDDSCGEVSYACRC